MGGRLNVSIKNGKLGGIPAIDLPAIKTCRPGAECAEKCYACKGFFRTPSKKRCMWENLRLWINDPADYEKQVIDAIYPYRFCRWHASGDIPSPAYLEMMVRVARALPGTRFLAFTKRYEFVNEFLNSGRRWPRNLTIVFSRWPGDALRVDERHNLPQAYFKPRHSSGFDIRWNAKHCHGSCSECAKVGRGCWFMKSGESVYFDEH